MPAQPTSIMRLPGHGPKLVEAATSGGKQLRAFSSHVVREKLVRKHQIASIPTRDTSPIRGDWSMA